MAGHLFVWVSGTKGNAPPRPPKRPSGKLRRAGTAVGSAQSLHGPEWDFREDEGSSAGSQRDTLPSETPSPPRGQ